MYPSNKRRMFVQSLAELILTQICYCTHIKNISEPHLQWGPMILHNSRLIL